MNENALLLLMLNAIMFYAHFKIVQWTGNNWIKAVTHYNELLEDQHNKAVDEMRFARNYISEIGSYKLYDQARIKHFNELKSEGKEQA